MEIRVVKIINENAIVLNIGRDKQITLKSCFEIYSDSDEEIVDPETKLPLGKLKLIKANVTPSYVADHYCICRNAKSDFFETPLSRPLPLNVNTEQISGWGGIDDSKRICIGDLARLIKQSLNTDGMIYD